MRLTRRTQWIYLGWRCNCGNYFESFENYVNHLSWKVFEPTFDQHDFLSVVTFS